MKRLSQDVFFGIPYGYPRLDKKEVMTLHLNLEMHPCGGKILGGPPGSISIYLHFMEQHRNHPVNKNNCELNPF